MYIMGTRTGGFVAATPEPLFLKTILAYKNAGIVWGFGGNVTLAGDRHTVDGSEIRPTS